MQPSAREAYLTTQVLTATPQKLHLMLIDGALRFAQQGRQHFEQQNDQAAGEALIRSQEIVGEMLASVGGGAHEASKKLAGVYLYLFRTLTEAHLKRDLTRLGDALRVLEIERDTWQQVCEQQVCEKGAGQEPQPNHEPPGPAAASPATAPRSRVPVAMPSFRNPDPNAPGISFSA